jgi:hypothetical protein
MLSRRKEEPEEDGIPIIQRRAGITSKYQHN